MFMIYIILMLISGLIVSPLMFCSYYRTKTRSSYYERWDSYPWKIGEKAKPQIWMWILLLFCLLIPVLNIAISLLLWLCYFGQLNGEGDYDGFNTTETRVIVVSKLLNKIGKFLTKEL